MRRWYWPVLDLLCRCGWSTTSEATSELSVLGTTAEARAKRLMELAANMDFIWLAYGLIRREVLQESGALGLYAGDDQVLLFKIALRGRSSKPKRKCSFGESTLKRRRSRGDLL